MNIRNIYVGNIPYTYDEAKTKEHFSQIGDVSDVRIPKNEDNKSRGFCFVDFSNDIDFDNMEAVKMMGGRELVIKVAHSKKDFMAKNDNRSSQASG